MRTMRKQLTRCLALAALASTVLLAAGPSPADAVVPGENGRIAYNRDGLLEGAIWVMNPDGTVQTPLTAGPETDLLPEWSPDGDRIAFTSFPDGGLPQIWVVNADGTGRTNLTDEPTVQAFGSSWSPDGTRLAFLSDRDGTWAVWVMNDDGSDPTRIADSVAEPGAVPAWSPDGSEIAFVAESDLGLPDEDPDPEPEPEPSEGNSDLYVIGADGDGLRQLTSDSFEEEFPAWSPDGSKLAFSRPSSGDAEIRLVDAQAGDPSTVLVPQAGDGFTGAPRPAWSPDGARIAFSADFDGLPDIYSVDASDGTGLTNLTNTPDVYEYTPSWGTAPADCVIELRLLGQVLSIRLPYWICQLRVVEAAIPSLLGQQPLAP